MTMNERYDAGAERQREKLVDELVCDTPQGLNSEQLEHLTAMVNAYQASIKSHLIEQQEKRTSWADRLADHIASFGGSWLFICLFAVFLVLWMLLNTAHFFFHWDKPPFILLNLILSCLSAFQAPVILMSQNRQAVRDKQEAVLDFAINFQAEQENAKLYELLEKLDRRMERLERQACFNDKQEG